MFILIRLIKRSSVSLGRSLGYASGRRNFWISQSVVPTAN